MKITQEMIDGAKNKDGHYSKAQRKLIARRFKSVDEMLGQTVENTYWSSFYEKRNETKSTRRAAKKLKSSQDIRAWTAHQKKPKPNKTIINKVSPNKGQDWSWKPQDGDVPDIKVESKHNKNQGKNKQRRAKVSRQDSNKFYESREWRELRVRILEKYECKCMMCGRSPKAHKVIIHCDHIKPRSKHPELSLTFDNLQLLCEDCNLGKSNKYDTDWRPELDKQDEIDKALDNELLDSLRVY